MEEERKRKELLRKEETSTDFCTISYTYTWNDTSVLGEGVDIYVIDSGIYLEHDEFGGRAVLGFNYYSDKPGDVFGHGKLSRLLRSFNA